MTPNPDNADIVVDQFTRQATPFANAAAMRDEEALRLLVEFPAQRRPTACSMSPAGPVWWSRRSRALRITRPASI